MNLSEDASYEHKQGVAIMQRLQYVYELKTTKRFTDPDLAEALRIMRTPGGAALPERIWQRIVATRLDEVGEDGLSASGAAQPAGPGGGVGDAPSVGDRLRQATDWVFCAYSWPMVTMMMHVRARASAQEAGQILYYVQAIDAPHHHLPRSAYTDMQKEPSLTKTKKLPGVVALHVGQRVKLTITILPPRLVPEATGTVIGFDLHPLEPSVLDRPSVAEAGCVMLRYMPRAVHVRMDDADFTFLPKFPSGVSCVSGADMAGVLAVKPVVRTWQYSGDDHKGSGCCSTPVRRTQLALVPVKVCTLYGLQGITADPGIVADWRMPRCLQAAQLWLAYYALALDFRRRRLSMHDVRLLISDA